MATCWKQNMFIFTLFRMATCWNRICLFSFLRSSLNFCITPVMTMLPILDFKSQIRNIFSFSSICCTLSIITSTLFCSMIPTPKSTLSFLSLHCKIIYDCCISGFCLPFFFVSGIYLIDGTITKARSSGYHELTFHIARRKWFLFSRRVSIPFGLSICRGLSITFTMVLLGLSVKFLTSTWTWQHL